MKHLILVKLCSLFFKNKSYNRFRLLLVIQLSVSMHFVAMSQPIMENLFDADGTVFTIKEDSSFYYFAGDIKSAGKVMAFNNFYSFTTNEFRNIKELKNGDPFIAITGFNGETILYSDYTNLISDIIVIEGNEVDTVFSTMEDLKCIIKGDTSYFILLSDSYQSCSIVELSKDFIEIMRWDISTDGYSTNLTYLDSILIITGEFKQLNNTTFLGAAYFNRNSGELSPVTDKLFLNMPSYIPLFYEPTVSNDFIYYSTKRLNFNGNQNMGSLFRVSRNTLEVDTTWKQTTGINVYETICGSEYLYIHGYDYANNRFKMFRLNYSDAAKDPNFEFDFNNNCPYARIDPHVKMGDYIYLGGSFTHINNKKIRNLARFNEISGELDMNWTPNPNDNVSGLSIYNDELFISGLYTTIGAKQVSNLFRASKATMEIDTAWIPSFNGVVNDIVITDNYLIAGGIFDTINGVAKSNLAKIDLVSAQVDESWNSEVKGIVAKLEFRDDLLLIAYGRKNFFESYYDTIAITQISNGAIEKKWTVKDIYNITDIDIDGDYAYVVGKITIHNPDTYFGFASINLQTKTLEAPWNFRAQDNILSVNHDEEYVYIGGEFKNIDEYELEGFARINKSTRDLDTNYTIKVMNNITAIEIGNGNIYLGSNHGSCDCIHTYDGKYARLADKVNIDYLSKEYIFSLSMVYSILHKDSMTILVGSFPYSDRRKSIMFLHEPNDIQANGLNIISELDSTVLFNWNRGDGEACALFISEYKDEFPLPDEWVDYKADSNYLTSVPLNYYDSWRFMYKGVGNQVNISNLSVNKKYRAAILEYSKKGDTYIYNGHFESNYIDFFVASPVDFKISNVEVSDSEVKKGEDVMVSFNIQNIGVGLSAFSCKVGAYLSNDTVFDVADILIDIIDANDLQSGSTDSLSFLFETDSISSGNYNILVVADYNEIVNESIENNNMNRTVLTILEPSYVENSSMANFKVYPNPVSEYLFIDSEEELKLQYKLFNSLGILMKIGEIDSERNFIQLNKLPDDSYYLQLINNNNNTVKTIKVIILH